MKHLFFLALFFISAPLQAGAIVKCQSIFGDISYADEVCPANTTQLSKTKLKPYKTSQSISHKDLKRAKAFPEHVSSAQQKAVFIARLSKVLTSLSAIKTKMTVFYMQAGVWPESFHTIKLKPKTLNSSLINKTILDKNGRIKVELNALFGKQKQLWLYPEPVMGNTQIEWQCFTNFPKSMLKAGNSDICISRDI